jgi:hypothetical protein
VACDLGRLSVVRVSVGVLVRSFGRVSVMSVVPAVHPVMGAVARVQDALKDVGGVNPAFMDEETQALALSGIAAAEAQLAELRLRITATATVAGSSGARDVAAWQAAHQQRDLRAARADARLAEALDRRFETLRVGMVEGRVHLDQAHVIARTLDDLPADVPTDTVARAEVRLVELAGRHTPGELRRLGRRILDTVAPEIAEQAEARRLEAEEASARRKTRLTFRRGGDGTIRISAVVPDVVAGRLKTYLDAFTSPRQGERRGEGPYPRILGRAFCSLLEHLDPDKLPRHGGRATTLVVTTTLEALQTDLAHGEVIGGEGLVGLSASELRRLACTAGIRPMVLGGAGEVLDLGREQRLFSPAQNLAMVVRDKTCRAEGCDVPAAWCESHHWRPWSQGGRTDLAEGSSLCSHHHHCIHDRRYVTDRLPNGDVRFTRRT